MEPLVAKSKTQIVSVLFVDIVGYSTRSVTQQVEIKRLFNAHLGEALSPVFPDDWILLDTGDGAAIAFLNSPEEALLTSDRLMVLAYPAGSEPKYWLRSGLHFGPVVIVRDVNGSENLVGDALNDAQRIMVFAGEDEVLSSRQYADLVARIDTSFADRFSALGYMQDKHGRAHELARVAPVGYRTPEKTAAANDVPQTGMPDSDSAALAHAEIASSSNAIQPRKSETSTKVAIIAVVMLAFAVVGWLIFRNSPSADTTSVPAGESSTSAVSTGASTPLTVEKQLPTSSSAKIVLPAPSVAKPVQELRKPAVPVSQSDISSSQLPRIELPDCPQCSCMDLLEKVSRGARLTAAETGFLRAQCQWQQSPQSGGVGKPSSLIKQLPVSAPGQHGVQKSVPASGASQVLAPPKPTDIHATDVRQPVAPSGQGSVQGIPDCPYCSCSDLLTKVSLGIPLSSTESKFLRTKCP